MKKTIVRPLAAVLALIMLVSVTAGCGKDNKKDPNSTPDPEFVYVADYIDLPEGVQDASSLCVVGEKIFFSSYTILDKETGESEQSLYSVNFDGTGAAKLPNYTIGEIPEGAEGSSNINSMCVDGAGNIWVLETQNIYAPTTSEGASATDIYYDNISNDTIIRKLDSTGAEISTIDLAAVSGDDQNFYVQGFSIDDKGNVYLSSQINSADGMTTTNEINVLSSSGEKLFKIEVQNWVERLVRMPDGSVAASAYIDTGYSLRKIDIATKTWGEEIALPQNAYNIFPGGGEYSVVFNDGRNLYGIDKNTGETATILNWLDCDISGDNMSSLTVLPDGRVLSTSYTYDAVNQESSVELVVITKKPYDSSMKRTELTLAAFYLDWNLRGAIVDFNKKSDTYRIKVKDYSEFLDEKDDYEAGMSKTLLKLSTDIISGNVPDMLDVANLPYKQYAGRGLLEDLYTYIDSDSELKRTDLIENVIKAAEINGGLYQINASFGITTIIGSPSILGSEMGWNMDEFNAVLDANPQATMPAGQYLIKKDFLRYALMMNQDEYVDWTAKKCYFDTGDFAKLLEMTSIFPDEYPTEEDEYVGDDVLIADGRQIMALSGVYDFESSRYENARFGGDIVYKGFPTKSKSGGVLTLGSGIAMTTKCEDKEGAWQFMRTILTEDYQRKNVSYNFPTNKIVFDEVLKKAMTPEYVTDENGKPVLDENGQKIEQSRGGMSVAGSDVVVEFYALTQEEADKILALIGSASGLVGNDESLFKIVEEGAADYYSGKKTAEEAAKIIQSKASLYVSEQG